MKLYIIVSKTLSVGLKCAQACHALRLFGASYPDLDHDWYENSNNIVVLEHDDIPSMAELLQDLGLNVACFHEPDLDDEMTALCVEPAGKRHLRKLRLAA